MESYGKYTLQSSELRPRVIHKLINGEFIICSLCWLFSSMFLNISRPWCTAAVEMLKILLVARLEQYKVTKLAKSSSLSSSWWFSLVTLWQTRMIALLNATNSSSMSSINVFRILPNCNPKTIWSDPQKSLIWYLISIIKKKKIGHVRYFIDKIGKLC